jgi:small subunit ribosomal protein S4
MGKPKFSRKKYETPSHPWQEDRIKDENELITKYGLKNKREIWKAQTRLRKYRGQARELLAKIGSEDPQSKKESDQLLVHLSRMNMLPPKSTLDDVLALETETILSRRLQTLTYLKGLANTPTQARQLISHGHIAIGENKVTVPSYLVTKEEEGGIGYTTDSALNDLMHPARPRADFKSGPVKKETKPEEEKPGEGTDEKPKEAPKEEKSVETAEEAPTAEAVAEQPKEETPSEQPTKEPEKPVETAEEAPEPPKEDAPIEEPPAAEPEAPAEEKPAEPTEEKPAEEPEDAPVEPPKEEVAEPEAPAEEPPKEEEKPTEEPKEKEESSESEKKEETKKEKGGK